MCIESRRNTYFKSPENQRPQQHPLLQEVLKMIPQSDKSHHSSQDMKMQKRFIPSMTQRRQTLKKYKHESNQCLEQNSKVRNIDFRQSGCNPCQ